MRIAIIDRDEVSANLMTAKLEGQGHKLQLYASKNDALEDLAQKPCDLIFLDPAPLTSPQPIVLNIRRALGGYPYLVNLSAEMGIQEAIQAGMNAALLKPVDPERMTETVASAQRLTNLIKRLGDDSEDFPSAGGVISKSAFYQLFFSGLERADRYGEFSYVLFIAVANYQEILEMDGPYAADFSAATLSRYLTRLRRQSDIIGQTAKSEYALLLQRPQYETEPVDAANRFGEALHTSYKEMFSEVTADIELSVKLVRLPTGEEVVRHIINKDS